MSISIRPENYEPLYKKLFSADGFALLKKEPALTEEEKAQFCLDVFSTFNPDTADEDAIKNMMLALKFVIDKNIANGLFLSKRGTNFQEGDFKNPAFVSNMILLSPEISGEKDFNTVAVHFKLDMNSKKARGEALSPAEQLIVDGLEHMANLADMLSHKNEQLMKSECKLSSNKLKRYFYDSFYDIKKPTGFRGFFINMIINVFNGLAAAIKPKPENAYNFPGNIFNSMANFFYSRAANLYATHVKNSFSAGGVSVKQGSGLLEKEMPQVVEIDREVEEKQADDVLRQPEQEQGGPQQDKGILGVVVDGGRGVANIDLDEENDEEKKIKEDKKIEIEHEIAYRKLIPPKRTRTGKPLQIMPTIHEDKELNEEQDLKDREVGFSSPIVSPLEFEKKEFDEKLKTPDKSKLWLITTYDLDKELDRLSFDEYQNLVAEVALEVDALGTMAAKHPVDAGAFSIVDPGNRLYHFFQKYLDKANNEFHGKNQYAYQRDSFMGVMAGSSHPGTGQIGIDIRGPDGHLKNIFDENKNRIPKGHILVTKLGDGQTYLKIEEAGLGTFTEIAEHAFNYAQTRKASSEDARKEKDVKPEIREKYKQIAEAIFKSLEDNEGLKIAYKKKWWQLRGKPESVEKEPDFKMEDDFVMVGEVSSVNISHDRYICEMYKNLHELSDLISNKDEAAKYIDDFKKICESLEYDAAYLDIRHGNEVVLDLGHIPDLKKDIGITTKEKEIFDEIMSLRDDIIEMVNIQHPALAETLANLGISVDVLNSDEGLEKLAQDEEVYEKSVEMIISEKEGFLFIEDPDMSFLVVNKLRAYLEDPSAACPKVSDLFKVSYKPAPGSKKDSRQQSAMWLMEKVMQGMHDKPEGPLFDKFFKISERFSNIADMYYNACQQEHSISPKDDDYKTYMDDILSMKKNVLMDLHTLQGELKTLETELAKKPEFSENFQPIIARMGQKITDLEARLEPKPEDVIMDSIKLSKKKL